MILSRTWGFVSLLTFILVSKGMECTCSVHDVTTGVRDRANVTAIARTVIGERPFDRTSTRDSFAMLACWCSICSPFGDDF